MDTGAYSAAETIGVAMTDQEARRQYVRAMAASTVWIRQRNDGQWEAINWEGKVIAFSKYRSECEREVVSLAGDRLNNIYATAIIVDPKDRQARRSKGMRRF